MMVYLRLMIFHMSRCHILSFPFILKIIQAEPLTDVLSATSMRSCLIFPHTTVAHSGNYVCHALENVQDQLASASINITVLG